MCTVYFPKCEWTISYIHGLPTPQYTAKMNSKPCFIWTFRGRVGCSLRQDAVDVLDKPAVLCCEAPHVSGGQLHPNPKPRCQEYSPRWDSEKGFRYRQPVPRARSAAFKKLYSKEKKRKQTKMKLNSVSEFFHTILYPNCSGYTVVWHWVERCYQKGVNFLGLAKKFLWFF